MATRLTRVTRLTWPPIRLVTLLCIMATAPVTGTALTHTNRTGATSSQLPTAAASGQTNPPPTESPEALTGSQHFRIEAADLLSHVTALLRRIQPKEYPERLQNTIALLISGEAATDLGHWWRLTKQLVSADPGLSAVVLSCLSLSVLVPVAAGVICCRRFCSQPPPTYQEDSTGQGRCRANCNVALIVFTLCIIFCLAVLLVAAALLIRWGLQRSGPALGSALADVQTVTTDSGGRLTRLLTADMGTAVRDTQRLMEGLQTVAARFLTLGADLTNLTSGWPHLLRQLGDLRADLERAASLCAGPDQHLCAGLQPSKLTLAELDISTALLDPSLSLVGRYRSVDLPALAEKAQASATALANSLQSGIDTVRPGISRELQGSVERAERYLAGAQPALRRLLDHLRSLTDRTRREPLVAEATTTVIWTSALAVPSLVLVITALLYGAVVGSYFPSRTSSRPHRHTINTIRLALFLVVLVSALVWVAAAVGALAGALTQASLCPEAGDRRPAEVAQVMRRLGLNSSLRPSAAGPVTPALTETLRQCEAGGSLLTVFDLGHPAEVTAAAQLSTSRLASLMGQVAGQTATDGQSDLLAGALDQYLRLARDLVDAELSTLKSDLEQPSLMTDVPGVLSQLSSVLSQLSSDSDRDRLQSLADRLTEIVTGPLYTLQKQRARLVVQVATFDMSLMSLRGQVTSLLEQIAQVDSFLSTNASHVIQQEESNFRSQLTARFQGFSNHVQTVLQRELSCRPIWEAFRSAASVTCHQLLGSIGAYWLACLLTGVLLLLLAAAALPLLTRLRAAGQRTLPGDLPAEDDSKLWRTTSSEMQQTAVKTSAPAPTSGHSGGAGRW